MNRIFKICLFALCLVLFSSSDVFAFNWQKEIDGIVQSPDKMYEVYRGMPWQDFYSTWENVPGWYIETWAVPGGLGDGLAYFWRRPANGDTVFEKFEVYYSDHRNDKSVHGTTIKFCTNDKRLATSIEQYASDAFQKAGWISHGKRYEKNSYLNGFYSSSWDKDNCTFSLYVLRDRYYSYAVTIHKFK